MTEKFLKKVGLGVLLLPLDCDRLRLEKWPEGSRGAMDLARARSITFPAGLAGVEYLVLKIGSPTDTGTATANSFSVIIYR